MKCVFIPRVFPCQYKTILKTDYSELSTTFGEISRGGIRNSPYFLLVRIFSFYPPLLTLSAPNPGVGSVRSEG